MNHVIHATIRRDAHTITPVTVFPHEIAILQTIFGKENIQNKDGKLLDLKNLTESDIAGQVQVSDNEFDRLMAKYGGNEDGALVEQVYGKQAAGGLEAAVERLAAALEKIAAKAPATAEGKPGRAPRGTAGAPATADGASAQE
ncbi:hypothetical protein [Achromobacter spanius]|uniref:hypothetical protein n=1 Tax=Achromobacter spanius TaxID=217203 RepID=UPI0016752C8D|nr:hypothetical protein [Achromobacter spanius]